MALAAPMSYRNGEFEVTTAGVHYLRNTDGEVDQFLLSTPVLVFG